MSWKHTFEALAEAAQAAAGDGHITLSLSAEDTDFVRFNGGLVRQAGSVAQGYLDVRRVFGRRHATETITVTGDPAADLVRLAEALAGLDATVPTLSEDPHLLLHTEGGVSERVDEGELPSADEAVATILGAAASPSPVDLVGIWQSGALHRAFASTFGHRHWFTASGFCFDYSVVHSKDRAVKRTFAGTSWSADALRADVAVAREALVHLARPAMVIPPGQYRAWLTPAAVEEVFSLLNWGDMGAKSQHTRASALGKLVAGEVALDPRVTVSEQIEGGLAPGFQGDGFVRPDVVPLIAGGRFGGALVSPRSALEFGLQTNGADAGETAVSLVMAGGDLPDADVLRALGTGVWISNLWYLNHSDKNAARITGMTRFATFWVEDGQIVAPLSVMRFDDSVYELLGSKLEAVGETVAMLPSTSTYGGRSTTSQRLPGLLVRDLAFTL